MLFCASVHRPCSYFLFFSLYKTKKSIWLQSDHHCTSVYHRRSFPHRDDNDHDYRAERGSGGTLDSHLVISLPCLHDCVVYDDDEAVRGDECCWYFWPTQLAHSRLVVIVIIVVVGWPKTKTYVSSSVRRGSSISERVQGSSSSGAPRPRPFVRSFMNECLIARFGALFAIIAV